MRHKYITGLCYQAILFDFVIPIYILAKFMYNNILFWLVHSSSLVNKFQMWGKSPIGDFSVTAKQGLEGLIVGVERDVGSRRDSKHGLTGRRAPDWPST